MNNLVLESTAARNFDDAARFGDVDSMPADAVSVLIVSSSAYLRVWIGRLLEREPGLCILDRVSSVGQGVRLAKRFHPDLVVCDPTVGRDSFLTTMFADGGCQRTRVVVVDPGLAWTDAEFVVPVEAILRQDLPPLEMARALRRVSAFEFSA